MKPEDALSPLLKFVVQNPDLHARWLNTLSFLEYVGWRKIVKSQKAEGISLTVLRHAQEEARHALMLKKLALKVGGSDYDGYGDRYLLCGDQAENYFQSVDSHTSEVLRSTFADAESNARMTYLYVTWLVEVRALRVYKIYLEATGEFEWLAPLKGLLSEEDRHLAEVTNQLQLEDPNFKRHTDELARAEESFYQDYLLVLAQQVHSLKKTFEPAHVY